MMAAPHAIHEEFPDDAQKIHDLKLSNNHFARLLEEYDEVNDKVHSAESYNPPITDEAEKQLRQQRAHLKDQIAAMLSGA
ncbi:DUF465 domain-containing protein [Paracoccus sp. M683]|nr:DUF465 domain-containing protein [Paracoccus sp. M683]